MLPKRDGLEVLKALRKQGKRTPVLVLTARYTLEDRVLGLNSEDGMAFTNSSVDHSTPKQHATEFRLWTIIISLFLAAQSSLYSSRLAFNITMTSSWPLK